MRVKSACNSNAHSKKIYLLRHGQSQSTACLARDKDLHRTLGKSCFPWVGTFSKGKESPDGASTTRQDMHSASAKWTRRKGQEPRATVLTEFLLKERNTRSRKEALALNSVNSW